MLLCYVRCCCWTVFMVTAWHTLQVCIVWLCSWQLQDMYCWARLMVTAWHVAGKIYGVRLVVMTHLADMFGSLAIHCFRWWPQSCIIYLICCKFPCDSQVQFGTDVCVGTEGGDTQQLVPTLWTLLWASQADATIFLQADKQGFCAEFEALPSMVTFPQALDLTTMW